MPLYGHMNMSDLPISLHQANGWACVMEVELTTDDGRRSDHPIPMSESDVRELIDALEEALR